VVRIGRSGRPNVPEIFRGILQSVQANAGMVTENRLRLVPSASFPINHLKAFFQSVLYVRGPFEKFVDSLYYSESELRGGAVTVSLSKHLPWQAMHF
jgi:hypothetical protein